MEQDNGQFKSYRDNYKFGISLLDRFTFWSSDVHNVHSADLLFVFKNQKDKGTIIMGFDFKAMLLATAETQADKMKKEAMDYIQSDEFRDKLAQLMNDKINIPFVTEEREGSMFKEVVETFQDLAVGLFESKS